MKRIFRILLVVLVVFCMFSVYLIYKSSSPFDPVRKFRKDMVENHDIIEMHEVDEGTMIYSVGKVNNGLDNMYFVDMVEKSLISYKWLGGGGHINRDNLRGEEFVFSAQLLNEEQNINPTIIGVCLDEEIISIMARTHGEYNKAVIFDRQQEGEKEKFYYIPFSNNVAENRYFLFEIHYRNNEIVEYIVPEISEFQKGRQVYFCNE